jgi:hypothetical protein
VISQFHRRHRSVDFRKFLDTLETQTPRVLGACIVVLLYGLVSYYIDEDSGSPVVSCAVGLLGVFTKG